MTAAEIAEIRTYELRRVVTGYVTEAESLAPGDAGPYIKIIDANDIRDQLLDSLSDLLARTTYLEAEVRDAHVANTYAVRGSTWWWCRHEFPAYPFQCYY